MKIQQSNQPEFVQSEIERLSKKFSVSELAVKTMIINNVKTDEEMDKFLHSKIEDLHNPFLLTAMKQAVELVEKHLALKSTILIYGDYDVDGISSVTILYNYFCSRGANIKYFIPSRSDDDYGLNVETLKTVVSKFHPNLIITVDCGISCHVEVDYLKSIGVDILITDHHDIPEIIPDTVVIDPKLENQDYPFHELCGAGVAYKLAVALNGGKDMESYLSVVALATVADIVPLIDENRVMVRIGLSLAEKYMPKGILSLCASLGIENLTSHEISFKISPRLNAPGRLGSPMDSLNLFLERNPEKINFIITKMEKINEERQRLCAETYADVVNILSSQSMSDTYAITLKSKTWHAGILGIVCARICEEYSRPVFLFSENDDGLLKGSGRSVGSIDIGNILRNCSELFVKFGGHSAAVGAKICEENFEKFKNFANNWIKSNYSTDSFTSQKTYDFELSPQEFTLENFESLSVLEPFGHTNNRPMFKVFIDSVGIRNFSLIKTHLAIKYSKVNAIGYNMQNYFKQTKFSSGVNLLLDCDINEYRGRKSVRGVIKALDCQLKNNFISECDEKEFLLSCVASNSLQKAVLLSESEMKEKINQSISKSCWGNLIIAGTNRGFKRFNNEMLSSVCIDFNEISSKSGLNTLILNPTKYNFEMYNKIFVLDDLVGELNLPLATNSLCEIYALKTTNKKVLSNIKTDRETFVDYYKLINDLLYKQNSFASFTAMFFAVKKLNPQFAKINFEQFYVCLKCFLELGIFTCEKTEQKFVFTKNEVNVDLSSAKMLKTIERLKEKK